ncbi:hypothetical protein ACNVED_09540 [Legionella sp. D16C41]|uniref:hypothetical protein n=1 Tax=Legionella sp. D16C41 TaxID=3402688 RepID=UPI003AF8EF06
MFKKSLILTCILMQSTAVLAANCETKREVFIENKTTKVWKTIICPNQKLPFHTHEFARVVIPKEDGYMEVIYQTGKHEVITLKKDKPTLLSVQQGRELHQDMNIGRKPIEVTVIELRK